MSNSKPQMTGKQYSQLQVTNNTYIADGFTRIINGNMHNRQTRKDRRTTAQLTMSSVSMLLTMEESGQDDATRRQEWIEFICFASC